MELLKRQNGPHDAIWAKWKMDWSQKQGGHLDLESLDVMTLARGKERRNGHLLPKTGAGLYEYKLKDGTISLYYMLSSNDKFDDYNFKRAGDQLTIDNFYDSSLGKALTFNKLY